MKIMNSLESIRIRKQKSKIYFNKFIVIAKSNRINRTCAICYEHEIHILIKPCNHLCVCIGCSKKIDACPMCREIIISKEFIKFG